MKRRRESEWSRAKTTAEKKAYKEYWGKNSDVGVKNNNGTATQALTVSHRSDGAKKTGVDGLIKKESQGKNCVVFLDVYDGVNDCAFAISLKNHFLPFIL